METIISLKDINVSYEGKFAVKNISIDFPKNKITSIIGPSGCGKTTLLKSMNKMIDEEIETYFMGNIILDGQNINNIHKDLLRRKVGLVFQNPCPFPFSIYKNMIYALNYYGIKNKQELKKIVREKLEMVGLYEDVKDDLNKNAIKLSGGQKQRLCIARALTVEPSVLLLDEPCSALDVKSTSTIETTLKKLKEKYSIIIVTHNIFQARRISDYVAFMDNGKIVEFDTTENIFNNPKNKETKEFITGIYG